MRFVSAHRAVILLAALILAASAGHARASDGRGFIMPGLPVITTPTEPRADGRVEARPSCFRIINRAGYTVNGTIQTNSFIDARGVTTHHRGNFRLAPDESTKICSSGPFYDGRRVELVLRTLIPIFNCRTSVSHDIRIFSEKREDGTTRIWADCT